MSKSQTRSYSQYSLTALALFGQMIRQGRIENNLTAQNLSERVGISRALLRRIENGDPGCAIGVAFEVAAIVGVPLFESDMAGLAGQLRHSSEKLALLRKSVHAPRKDVNDDF
jgi:transcriptional regulator with XRE-family HTH domain